MRRLVLLTAFLTGCLADFPAPPASPPVDVQRVEPVVDAELDAPGPALDADLCDVPEVCDGVDQDCDGLIDESVPIRPCPLQAGVCQASRQLCQDGVYQPCFYTETDQPYAVEEGPPTFCDWVDNDCDGSIDEGCACEDGDSQDCGVNTGACSQGRQLCSDGTYGICRGGVVPTVEFLNQIDDDCDGQVDEGSPPEVPTLDLADIAVGGVGDRPGLPGQVARAAGLPIVQPGAAVLRPAPLVAAVFVPSEGITPIGGASTYDFVGLVSGSASAGVHGKGPAALIPHPADATGQIEYRDPLAHSFIEMPANYGISFDIATINRRVGRPARHVSLRLGTLGPAPVTFVVLVDGQQHAINTVRMAGDLNLDVPLLPHVGLLTLVTTNAGIPGGQPAYIGDPLLHFR